MADTPADEPAPPADPPHPQPSPPTRKQHPGAPVPSPHTREQHPDSPAPPRPRGPKSAPARPEPAAAPAAAPPPGAPSPATRLQGSDAPTGAGGAGRADPPTRREAHATTAADFPPALLDRYTPYAVAGTGSEGTVWHVRRHADGTDAAMKIAHPGQSMDLDTLEHLASAEFRRHVPRIHEFGDIAVGSAVRGWVAMEYLPTTLEDHLTRRLRDGKPREDRAHTERTVRELADMLDFWQSRVDRNPLDLKPANILVRRADGAGDGFELVVADFGGVARFTVSQSYRDFQITALYMAPEQIVNQNLKATPWWSLGLVLYQVFTGRPLYVLGDDARITDEAWTRGLILNHEVDLTAVTDPRQNLLLQGLLTKDPDDRWSAAEVRRWLRGEEPAVVRPAAPAAPAAARHANRPITFRGTPHHEAESLAAAMARYSEEAAEWLAGADGPRLAAWLRDELADTSFDSGQLFALASGPDRAVRAAVAALSFVAAFAPTATPQYRGRRVDAEGIARIAQGQGAVAFVDELLKANVPTIAAGFRCAHARCGDRCEVLLTLAADFRRTVEGVRAQARAVGRRNGAGADLDARETDGAYGLAAALIVHPEQRTQLLLPLAGLPGPLTVLLAKAPPGLLGPLARFGALRRRSAALLQRGQDGGFTRRWAELHRRAAGGNVRTAEGRTALVAAAVLLPRALRADAIGQDHEVTFAEWWSTARLPLAQRAGAAAALFTMFLALIWSGAMLRYVRDSGLGDDALDPDDRLVVPLTRAADAVSATQTGLCAVAVAGALAFAAAPARIPGRLLLAAAALVAWVGYGRQGLPPLDRLHTPDALAGRLHSLLGGWHSGNGFVGLVLLPVVCILLLICARWLLGQARDAEEQRAGLRRARAEQRRVRAGLPRRPFQDPNRWRSGPRGLRDRALFAAAALLALITLLWAAVEVRVALTAGHPTAAGWGSGQQGASYQSSYVLACAAACGLAALCATVIARRVFVGAAIAVVVLGAWPPPVEPARAVSMPVLPDLFGWFAGTWGHAAFWAALLVALPVALYAGGFAVRRTRRAAR